MFACCGPVIFCGPAVGYDSVIIHGYALLKRSVACYRYAGVILGRPVIRLLRHIKERWNKGSTAINKTGNKRRMGCPAAGNLPWETGEMRTARAGTPEQNVINQ